MKAWVILRIIWILFGAWLSVWLAYSTGYGALDAAFGTYVDTPSPWLLALFVFGGGFFLGRSSVRNTV